MKKTITLYTALLLVVSVYAQQLPFCEDFESLLVGDPIAEISSSWNSWDELMNGSTAPFIDDARISSTQSSSGSNSLYFPSTAAAGPEDILLMFDPTLNITQTTFPALQTPYVVGNFTFSQMMYIRAGAGAYFNFQAENMPGVSWALEVNFTDNGSQVGDILMSNTSGTSFAAEYPVNTWFEIAFDIDLSNNNWEVLIDGASFGSFTNSINKIASLDLYPRINDEFYIDDVCYDYVPATLDSINGQVSNMSSITGLVGQTRYPSVEIRNFGLTTINSYDVTIDYNGSQITENLTLPNINLGFGLASLQTMIVEFSNPITLAAGETATAYIYNINNGTPQNTSDDTLTLLVNAVTPAPGKLVIGEEATGTWCQWCPRGAVALNWMDHDYAGYWQGIAVHNGDLMVDPDYDNGMAPYIGGYPSGLVDRGPEIDPSDFKQDFLQRIVIPPSGTIINGAELNGNILTVSLTVDFQTAVSGNYKLACVIVEDSVTGTGPDYYQANAYSGGTSLIDVDGQDWNQLPGNVPDYMMTYRHVGRSISPSFAGGSLNETAYNLGDSETSCFEFTLDPLWDQSQIHIVGMLLDPNNGIDNASSSTIDDAVSNGYSPCATSSTALELNGPDRVNIYPNPASEKVYISNLKEENTIIKIFDITGSIVLEGNTSNKEELNISTLSKGIYQIKFEGANWTETRKLIKN